MANQRHVNILVRNGVRAWNLWRTEETTVRPDLSEADLRGATFFGEADLPDMPVVNLGEVDLRGADLRRATLFEVYLSDADLSNANLSDAHLKGVFLERANLRDADLHGANLDEAVLTEAHFGSADLRDANLRWVNLMNVDLRDANLSGAHLSYANLSGANLGAANLSGANLGTGTAPTSADFHKVDIGGIVAGRTVDLSGADLSEANLSGARLRGVDVRDANLRGANLSGATLFDIDLSRTNLSEANLSGATLIDVDLSGTLCVKTTFTDATLIGCNVYGMSAWDVTLDGTKQAALRINPPGERSALVVDSLEVAQFLYLLLRSQKVRSVLDTITSKVVLILGRVSTERTPVLDVLLEALRRHPNGYIPVLLDVDPQRDKPVRDQPDFETVQTLATLARFVIVDLTDLTMVRSEVAYITANLSTVPIQPVIASGANLPTEYEAWQRNQAFLNVYHYSDSDPTQLLANFTDAVIAPVEEYVVARRLAAADGT
jgi:uncharacterized protein YjbI with pentapeptide repeats